ncbi:LCP family protein [Clostridium perfringens]|uniref:LCP family glycopolymer transferase n=1 Tax=Clostridium perfringens TaxID=1502 RepID=UPI0008A69C47|nr:LCP family protein [Clostridium perfringens]AOY52893.1 hypothetical protein FORC25_0473 [Clostridium perfringens]MDK0680090.1 LCP family protein [Clostridium perfringens]MDK0781478.1 LCP family protein [Clostridium perfringens]MDK0858282.1 LCP family protein [Clostridium perfringens]MDM0559248.1 LCP family protein [Clostridium perfringens]
MNKKYCFIGIDALYGKVGRSDNIIILTLDEEHKVIKLTSIMRNSYVNIPCYEYDKVNRVILESVFEKLRLTTIKEYTLLIDNFCCL